LLSCRSAVLGESIPYVKEDAKEFFKPDECCISYEVSLLNKAQPIIFCSTIEDCAYDIKLLSSQIYSACIHSQLETFNNYKQTQGNLRNATLSLLQTANLVNLLTEVTNGDLAKYFKPQITQIVNNIKANADKDIGALLSALKDQLDKQKTSPSFDEINGDSIEGVHTNVRLEKLKETLLQKLTEFGYQPIQQTIQSSSIQVVTPAPSPGNANVSSNIVMSNNSLHTTTNPFDIFLKTLHTQLGGQNLDDIILKKLGNIFFGDEGLLKDIIYYDITIPFQKLQELMNDKLTQQGMHDYLRALRDQKSYEINKQNINSKVSPCDKNVNCYLFRIP
jgi:hypothetical protein